MSAGFLSEPERLHPGADVARLTASAVYAREWRGSRLDATLAWARNRRTPSTIPVSGGLLLFPGSVSQALLGEAAFGFAGRHTITTRVEFAQKDELFDIADPRHAIRYPVVRGTLGYVVDLLTVAPFTVGAGVAGSWLHVDPDLRPLYGGPPASGLALMRIRMH